MTDVIVVIVNSTTNLATNIVSVPQGWNEVGPGEIAVPWDGPVGIGWPYDGTTFTAPAPVAATTAQLLAEASQYQDQLLASTTWQYTVEDANGNAVVLTTLLGDRGQASMMKLAIWAGLAGAGDVEPYGNVDFSSTTITPAMARSLAVQAGATVSSSYAALNGIAADILADPPTITTTTQITSDARWPRPAS